MSYKAIASRLAALESPNWSVDALGAGQAPKAWEHLAAWALLLHDAGGWDAIDTLPEEPNPYNRIGYLWVITHFWQRGTDRFLCATHATIVLDVIVAAVEYLLEQGTSRAEIKSWQTGREVWEHVWTACQEDPQPWDRRPSNGLARE